MKHILSRLFSETPTGGEGPIRGIAEETLSFILSIGRESHPSEYAGVLQTQAAATVGLDGGGRVITDVAIIPGTTSTSVSATLRSDMVPNTRAGVGIVHSHPSGALRPSTKDLNSAFQTGEVHIIVGHPYTGDQWRAFTSDGDVYELPVLDVDLPDLEAAWDDEIDEW